MTDIAEDRGTVSLSSRIARTRPGSKPPCWPWRTSAGRRKARSSTGRDEPIELAFKLYPWEWMLREDFGTSLPGASTQWVEPPWKAILSNKGILPLLWAMFPRHPNLLPAYFDDDEGAATWARPTSESRSIRAKAPMSSSSSAARRSIPMAVRTARKDSSARASRRCRSSAATMSCSARGSPPASVRTVGARGCKPDHQEHLALPAARDHRIADCCPSPDRAIAVN